MMTSSSIKRMINARIRELRITKASLEVSLPKSYGNTPYDLPYDEAYSVIEDANIRLRELEDLLLCINKQE